MKNPDSFFGETSKNESLVMNILLIGASSFLGCNLKHLLTTKGYEITGISTHLGEKIPYEKIDRYMCAIYVKPDADDEFMDVKHTIPVLSIGSGALIDYKMGKMDINPYVESKMKLVRMSTCTIHPGFFIPSGEHIDTGRGLHRDTLMTLFGDDPIPEDYNMEKSYYMTPVDKLMELILKWVECRCIIKGEYAFGSSMPISRLELKEGLEPTKDRSYQTYMNQTALMFGLKVTDRDIAEFTANAKSWAAKKPYEGAGMLLHYRDNFILGIRLTSTPVSPPEVEYMGGKIEKEDGDVPFKTAWNEVTEEVGQTFLDEDCEKRAKAFYTFQPFSKKWMWLFLLELSDTEYNKLVQIDSLHDNWDSSETRDLSKMTGRPGKVKKEMTGFVKVSKKNLIEYASSFSKYPKSDNRMKDAKDFRKEAKPFETTRLFSGEVESYGLRSFNIVIFDNLLTKLSETF